MYTTFTKYAIFIVVSLIVLSTSTQVQAAIICGEVPSCTVDADCGNGTCVSGSCNCGGWGWGWGPVTIESEVYYFTLLDQTYSSSTCKLTHAKRKAHLETKYTNSTTISKVCKPLWTQSTIDTQTYTPVNGTNTEYLEYDLSNVNFGIQGFDQTYNLFFYGDDGECFPSGGGTYNFSKIIPIIQLNGGRIWSPSLDSCACPSGQSWNGSTCISTCNLPIDCAGTCGWSAIDYNGAAAGCGSPANCSNLPPNATPCNSLSPSSNTNYTTVSSCSSPAVACEAQCAGATIFNGGICEPPAYTQYSCGAGASCAWGTQWAWTANASCSSITYNPSNIYARNLSVCNNTPPPASSCQSTCEDPACGSTAGTCDVWSPSNDNNSNTCNTSRTWNCGAASCSVYNWPCVSNGICWGSVWVCASPAQASNVTASTWTCPGTNSGADASCGTTGPTVSCGDGVVNQARETCDNGSNNTNQCNSSSSVCSTSCAVIDRCCAASNNYSCDNVTTRRISGTRADCSSFNEVDPNRPFNTCCQGGAWITSPSAGADNYPNLGDPTNFSCNGNTLPHLFVSSLVLFYSSPILRHQIIKNKQWNTQTNSKNLNETKTYSNLHGFLFPHACKKGYKNNYCVNSRLNLA